MYYGKHRLEIAGMGNFLWPEDSGGDCHFPHWSLGTRRVELTVGVSYSDNLDKVRKVLQGTVDSDERVLKDPALMIAVKELADSSVNFVVRVWVRTENYWDVLFETTETVKKRFDEEGISIPFPQSDVHLYEQKTQ